MEDKTDYIFARVLSGNASLDDLLYLGKWLNEEEKNKKEFGRLKSYWDAEVSCNEVFLPQVSFAKVQQRIKAQERVQRNRRLRRKWLSVAASVAILICLTIGCLVVHQEIDTPREYHTYLTNDNHSHFTLNDGTKITLNKYSKLTCTSAYGTENRHVGLEGEAYFEVASDPGNPFQVVVGETKDAVITVLGTVFNVKADVDNAQVTATLVEGSIVFEAADQTVKMQPDQQLTYTFATQNINLSEVNATDEVLWKDGLIKYKTVTLKDLVEELEKRFGVPITIQDKRLRSSSVTVSGTFTEAQSLAQILDVISNSLPAKWTKDEKGYYIK